MKARDNPFTVDRIHKIRYRPPHTTIEDLLTRLELLNHRAAIIGPDGSGKTTLLEDLATQLSRQGRAVISVFVNDTCPFDRRRLCDLKSQLGADRIVLADGADAVPRPLWIRLKAITADDAAGLVITSHRPGLLPTLIECETTAQLLRDIVRDLAPPADQVESALVDQLFDRHKGDIRAALRELYDIWATRA